MTPQVLSLLLLLGSAVALLAANVLAPEMVGLLLLVGLYFTRLLPASELFAGFGSDAVVFLASLFVLSHGLLRTGALDRLELLLARQARRRPFLAVAQLVCGTGLLSAGLSNTATVASVLPVASAVARRLQMPPSKLFMPIAYASILGGTLTLIGTSTNIVAAGALARLGERPWRLFELLPIALPAAALGLVYLLTVGQRLLPSRGGDLAEHYRIREYMSEVVVPPGSPWVDRTLRELRAGADLEVTAVGLVRDGSVLPVAPDRPLVAGDRLLVRATQQALLRIKSRSELELHADAAAGPERRWMPVHEAVLAHASQLSGRTLRELGFASRYGVAVLALFRRGEPVFDRLASVPLRDGDALLLQGDPAQLDELLRGGHLVLLEEHPLSPAGGKMWLAIGIFAAVLAAGGMHLLPFAVAAVLAALIMVASGCMTPRQAYEAIDWSVLVLVGSLLGLAGAMESSGAGRFLATHLASAMGGLGPLALLAGFYLLTVLLAQPISPQAAVLVILPLAVYTARHLHLEPRAFAAAVTLAASCSFIGPLEPASLLVYGPGRYRFGDFFRVGLPLTLLVFVSNMLLVPRIFPLRPQRPSSSFTHRTPPAATSRFSSSLQPRTTRTRPAAGVRRNIRKRPSAVTS